MHRLFGLILALALALYALPASAQQDTSAAGRQATGVATQDTGAMRDTTTMRAEAEAEVGGQMEAEGEAMPRTASALPLAALAGALLIGGGLALRYVRRSS